MITYLVRSNRARPSDVWYRNAYRWWSGEVTDDTIEPFSQFCCLSITIEKLRFPGDLKTVIPPFLRIIINVEKSSYSCRRELNGEEVRRCEIMGKTICDSVWNRWISLANIKNIVSVRWSDHWASRIPSFSVNSICSNFIMGFCLSFKYWYIVKKFEFSLYNNKLRFCESTEMRL